MAKDRQIAIIFFAFSAGMIAIAGFLLKGNYLQDKISFNNSDSSFNLFSDFKTGKEKAIEAHCGSAGNSNIMSSRMERKIIFCWNKNSGRYEKSDLDPTGAPILSKDNFQKNEHADSDGDGISEKYDLGDGRLTVWEDSRVLWQSDENWWVEDFFLADSDNDGKMNLNLSVWKSGDFGKYKPFWVKENNPSVKNHFFVFILSNNNMKPVWQSSNLSAPNCRIMFSDLDGDGKNDLIALEGDYAQSPDCKGEYISVWKWNEWGFVNEWRSEKGEFNEIKTYETEGKKYIIGFAEQI